MLESQSPAETNRFSAPIGTVTLTGRSVFGSVTTEPSGELSIRPLRFRASDEALADLRRRIAETKWSPSELVTDPSQGVQLATMSRLANYWQTGYDWRKCEATLNALPNFVTTIDGVHIHFIHVRSKHSHALPVIITHGWP